MAAEGVLELGREEGRVAGERTKELGFNSSPNSPGAKVTTEQNPSELDTTRILPGEVSEACVVDVGDSSEGCCLLGVVEHDGILSGYSVDESVW